MIDELEVKGLEHSSDNEDIDIGYFYDNFGFRWELKKIFESLGVFMTNSIILIIQEYCKPGITYLHTSDGGWFPINLKALRLSKLLCIQAESNPFEAITVNKVSKHIMSLVTEYLIHHNGKQPAEIAKPIRNINMCKLVEDPWDAWFANKMSKREIFQLILAANYIDCQSLLQLGCAKFATFIVGKSPEEIKRFFSEEDDHQIEQNNQPVPNQPDSVQNQPEPLRLEVQFKLCITFVVFCWCFYIVQYLRNVKD